MVNSACRKEIAHSQFVDNVTRDNGGAIYLTYPGTQIIASDAHFEDNIVTRTQFLSI